MEVKGDLNIDGTLTVNNAPVTGGTGINVQEQDGSPSVSSVTTIKVTNGTLTDNGGGTVSISTGGGGGSVNITDGTRTVSSVSTISFAGDDFYLAGSTVNLKDDLTLETLKINKYEDMVAVTQPSAPASGTLRIFGVAANSGHTSPNIIDSDGTVMDTLRDTVLVARNDTGVSIALGSVVYFSGSTGSTPNIALAKADAKATSPAKAITMEVIANGSSGRVLMVGTLTGKDLSAFTEGDRLFLSPSVAGGVTNSEPTHPNVSQLVAVVLRANANGILQFVPGHSDGDDFGTNQTSFTIGAAAASSVILQPASTAQRTATFPDKSGTLAMTSDITPAFYYLVVQETDGNPPPFKAHAISFDSNFFYLSGDSANVPVVSLRAQAIGGAVSANFASSTQWQMAHNLGTANILWDVYDDQGEAVIPDKVATSDPNTAYFYFTEAVAGRAVIAGGSASALSGVAVRDIDTSPTVSNISIIEFSNGLVTNQGGGVARVTIPAGLGITVKDDVHTVSNATTIALNAGGFYLSGTSDGAPVINLRYDKDIYPIFVELGGAINVATDPFCQYPYTIEYADYDCRSGSVSGGFYIIPKTNPNGLGTRVGRGQPVSGMDGLQINQTPRRSAATAANRSVNPGDAVLFTLYGNAAAKHVRVTLVCKKP